MRLLAIALALFACAGNDEPSTDAGSEDAGTMIPPRRVLFVVQNSNSMAVADPDERRKTLVEEAFGALEGDVRFSLLVFSDAWRDSLFVEDPANDPQIASLLMRLEDADNLGALEGALRRAQEIIVQARGVEQDPAIEWSVVLLIDGFPTPTCTEAIDINPICETMRNEWAMFGFDTDDPTLFYGFPGDRGAYNRREDALAIAADLSRIAKVHAILLYSESLVGRPIEMSLMLNRGECAAFVEALATAGGGNSETRDGAAIDWNAFLGG